MDTLGGKWPGVKCWQQRVEHGLPTAAAGLHIDHFFLNALHTPPGLGTFAFALCAITAHLHGLAHVPLVAAGGAGFDPRHIGYRVWPRLGSMQRCGRRNSPALRTWPAARPCKMSWRATPRGGTDRVPSAR